MNAILAALLTVGAIWVASRLWRRRRRTNLGSNVSPRWLSNHEYDREGDSQQSK